MLPDAPTKRIQQGPITITRPLSASVEILVRLNQIVSAGDVIGQTPAMTDISVVNVGQALDLSGSDISAYLLKNEHDTVVAGEIIAKRGGRLPFSKKTCLSPVSGQIVAIAGRWLAIKADDAQSQPIKAFVSGQIVETPLTDSIAIQTEGILIEAACGCGGEAYGPLHCVSVDEIMTLADGDVASGDRPVLAIAAAIDGEVWEALDETRVAGLIVGSFDSAWLKIDSPPKVPVVATDRFGQTPMAADIFALLKQQTGKLVSIRGIMPWEAQMEPPAIIISDPL